MTTTTNTSVNRSETTQTRWQTLAWVRLLPVLIPMLFFIWNGTRGIDFGYHWDEPFMVRAVQDALITQVFLPETYNYPSVAFNLSVLTALPELIDGVNVADRASFYATFQDDVSYLFRLRNVFLIMTATTMLSLYLIVMRIYDNPLLALLAASLFAASWETAYHARWVAPDGLVLTTATLTLLLSIMAVQNPTQRWRLWLAAAAAGLTIGSKYSVALVGVYVAAATFTAWREQQLPIRSLISGWIQIAVIAIVVFLITTPGSLLDTQLFIANIEEEIIHYSSGHHNHTVNAGFEHFSLMIIYLGAVVFSPYAPVALIVSALVLIGIYGLWRKSPQIAFVVLSFPLLYLLYMSNQRVLIVRNVLVFIPVMALLAASGVYFIWQKLSYAPMRYALATGLIAILSVNIFWNIRATETVVNRLDQDAFVRQAGDFIVAQGVEDFCVSNHVRNRMASLGYTVTTEHNTPYLAFWASDIGPWEVLASRIDLTERWFGPYEVNYDYYPDWWGDDRIVIMDASKAPGFKVNLPECGIVPE